MLPFIVAFIIAWIALSFLEVFLGETGSVLGHLLGDPLLWEAVAMIGFLYFMVRYEGLDSGYAVLIFFLVCCPILVIDGRRRNP